MGTETTTATAGAAGAACGAIVGWAISAVTGADVTPIALPLGVVGAFVFGRVFPR